MLCTIAQTLCPLNLFRHSLFIYTTLSISFTWLDGYLVFVCAAVLILSVFAHFACTIPLLTLLFFFFGPVLEHLLWIAGSTYLIRPSFQDVPEKIATQITKAPTTKWRVPATRSSTDATSRISRVFKRLNSDKRLASLFFF
jgi:hypothetical protein